MTAIPPSEAACLLAGGTLYRTRVGLMNAAGDGQLVFAGFKKGAFSIYFGDAPIYHFDLEGRWQRAYVEPTHFLKGLDTRVHAIDRVREGANLVLHRHLLDDAETAALDQQVRGIALGLLGELERGRLRREDPPPGKAQPLDDQELRAFLARIAAWDEAAWSNHRAAYHATYGPLPFLPPECQNAVVLQATCGDAGGLAFGGRTVADYTARTPEEFARHVDQVVRLLGRRLMQSRVAFVGGSDFLKRPIDEVAKDLELVASRLPLVSDPEHAKNRAGGLDGPTLDGAYAFLDDFSAPLPGPKALSGYRERHLVHVSLGLESGDPAIRSRYGRHWSDDGLRKFVADLRAAGIGLSILTLVGAGGPGLAEAHRAGTARLLRSLDLNQGETVFLLDERELCDPEDAVPGAGPWDAACWQQHQAAFKQELSPLRERGVKVLAYSLEKQWG